MVNKLLQILFSFLFRTVIMRYIGNEILGLDGIFSSILNMLNMADLGISTAVTFSLYKPLADGDDRKVFAIMSFFQKFYMGVGVFVLTAGFLLIPALPYIVNIPDGTQNAVLIYILSVISTAATYFLSSRRIIFEADQETFRLSVVDTVTMIVTQVAQIVLLLVLKNYIAVLILRILCNLASNTFIFLYARQKYGFFRTYKKIPLSKEDRRGLLGNTGAVMVHKVGGVLVSGTDNLIISVMLNTLLVGFYSNYQMVIGSIGALVIMVITAVTPSVGNLKVTSDDIEHHYATFKIINGIGFYLTSFCCICLACLLQPFILAWGGEEYLLDPVVVLILCMNFYLSTMRFPINAFLTAAGYFKKTMFKPLLEGVINLVVSIVLTYYIGLAGVFIGTTVSLVAGSLWVDPVVTYRHWFKKNPARYFGTYAVGLLLTAGLGAGCYFLSQTFALSNAWADFIVKAVMVAGISASVLAVCMCRTSAMKFALAKIKDIICKIIKKKPASPTDDAQ